MGPYKVIQRTGDSYFELNGLLRQWNQVPGNKQKRFSDFIKLDSTEEFIKIIEENELKSNYGVEIYTIVGFQAIKKIKGVFTPGKGSSTGEIWVHPLLFLDCVMWLDSQFKYLALSFLLDRTIDFRICSGDDYLPMCKAIATIVEEKYVTTSCIQVAVACNWVVFGEHRRRARNDYGTEEKQKELFTLERKITELIEEDFIMDFKGLMNYLQKLYLKRYKEEIPYQFRIPTTGLFIEEVLDKK
jgi:hypothetical protein